MVISMTLEPGRSPFFEREQALFEVRGTRRELQRERLALHGLGEPCLERAMDAVFRESDRDRRATRELADERRRGGFELVVGNGAVDEAARRSLGTGELAAEQQQLLGARQAYQAREQPGRTTVRAEPPLDEWLPEAGRLGRDREVGGGRQLEAEAGRPAAHRADDPQLEVHEQLD